jgi:hypothetical protein
LHSQEKEENGENVRYPNEFLACNTLLTECTESDRDAKKDDEEDHIVCKVHLLQISRESIAATRRAASVITSASFRRHVNDGCFRNPGENDVLCWETDVAALTRREILVR